jgi:hypothetical protein
MDCVRSLYNAGIVEDEILVDVRKAFGPSSMTGRGQRNLCLGNQRRRYKKKYSHVEQEKGPTHYLKQSETCETKGKGKLCKTQKLSHEDWS